MKMIRPYPEEIEDKMICSSLVSSSLCAAVDSYKTYSCIVLDKIGRFWALSEYPVASNDVCWEVAEGTVMELVEVAISAKHFPFLSTVWNRYVIDLKGEQ